MIETLDSLDLVQEIDKRCAQEGKIMPVLIEINSGKEPQKYGVILSGCLGIEGPVGVAGVCGGDYRKKSSILLKEKEIGTR